MALIATPVLYHRSNKEGRQQIAIRLTRNRKSSYVFLGHYIDKKQWDTLARKVKKNHPNSVRLNAFIAKKLVEVNQEALNHSIAGNETSASAIHKEIVHKNVGSSFFDEASDYINNLKEEGKYNRYVTDKPRVERFKKYMKNDNVRFEEVTVGKLMGFKAFLKSKYEVSERTAINYLIVIRTIYNRGISNGLVDAKHYPFGRGKVGIKFPESTKLGLSRAEMKSLIDIDLSDSPKLFHARTVWLLSFYFAGMRISDLLQIKWSDIHDGRLFYGMDKNEKFGSLPVTEEAVLLLDHFRSDGSADEDYILPELNKFSKDIDKYTLQRKTSYAVGTLNKYLRRLAKELKLTKKLTTHIARHTFGGLAGDRIPIQMLQGLYRHSSITTTIQYQKSFIHKDSDEALRNVISLEE